MLFQRRNLKRKIMVWNAQQVEAAQNAEPTDWSKYDTQLSERDVDANNGRFAFDNRLHVKFFMRSTINVDKSTEANRPIYDDVEYVEIMMPGEKRNIIERPAASMRDDLRFPKQYAQFRAGVKDQISGTPLKVLPFMTDARVEEMAFFKIFTVEQLAELSDSVQFMGSVDLKRKAKEFIDRANGADALRDELNAVKRQLAEMMQGKKSADVDLMS